MDDPETASFDGSSPTRTASPLQPAPLNVSAVVIGEEILNLQKRIHVTSLVVTHDRDLAFGIADRIAVMHEGEILALGTVEEIRQHKHPVIHRFLTADFRPNHQQQPP